MKTMNEKRSRAGFESELRGAFAPMPDEVRAGVEAAFRRGEKEMRKRHKLMLTLTAAAALAVTFAAVALSAGGRMNPGCEDVLSGGAAVLSAAGPEQTATLISRGTAAPIPAENADPASERTAAPIPAENAATVSEVNAASVPEERLMAGEAELPVYCTTRGNYYHAISDCSGMQGAQAATPAEAAARGLSACPVCRPGTPEHYELFTKAFLQELSDLYPGCAYHYTGKGENGESVWYLCDGTTENAAADIAAVWCTSGVLTHFESVEASSASMNVEASAASMNAETETAYVALGVLMPDAQRAARFMENAPAQLRELYEAGQVVESAETNAMSSAAVYSPDTMILYFDEANRLFMVRMHYADASDGGYEKCWQTDASGAFQMM